MTIVKAHQEFKFRCDKLDALNYPNFFPEEIDLILNNAQQRIIKQRYGLSNNKRQSFEETQKRTEDLKNVTVNAVFDKLTFVKLLILLLIVKLPNASTVALATLDPSVNTFP